MASKKNAYLIVRYLDKNLIKIIDFTDINNNLCGRTNNLEQIDLYTSQFKNKDELITDLIEKRKINSKNVDIFIAKKKNDKNLNFYEVIYNPYNEQRITCLQNIAKKNIGLNTLDVQKDIEYIYSNFFEKYKNIRRLREIVLSDITPLYSQFTKYLSYNTDIDLSKIIALNGGWILNSYPLIRNIIALVNQYNNLSNGNSNIFKEYLNNLANLTNQRIIYKNELLKKTDPNYIEGQLSLFDSNFSNETSFKEDLTLPPKKEFTKEEIINYIMKTFEKLPVLLFIFNKEKNVSINNNIFNSNITIGDLTKLKTLINQPLLYELFLLNYHIYYYQIESNFLRKVILKEDINRYYNNILNNLVNDDNLLKNCLLWCDLFNNYLKNKNLPPKKYNFSEEDIELYLELQDKDTLDLEKIYKKVYKNE